MADLEALIKYRKHIVDEKQRFLSQLYRDAEKIEQEKQKVHDEMMKERALAEDSPDSATYLGQYLEGARNKIGILDRNLQKLEMRIAAAQEDMRAAFAEQKKIEITQRKRVEKEDAARKKKDDTELDEIAIEGHRRRSQDES